MNDALNVLLALIRFEIKGEALSDDIKNLITPSVINDVTALARTHDIANIAADALMKNGFISRSDEHAAELLKQLDLSVMRCAQHDFALAEASEALCKAKIPHIPLKGSVIKNLYPQPWMRTSCDIDILVREDDFEPARKVIESLGYEYYKQTRHDVSLASGSVHIELHFSLVEDQRANEASSVLASVWDESSPVENGYRYVMSDAMFYFYGIAHIVKHFESAGCGIRQIIDLYILDELPGFDLSARDELLLRGDLYKFASAARQLAKVWFAGAEHSEESRGLEEVIASSGVYGSARTQLKISVIQSKSRAEYIRKRIFPSRDALQSSYPVLRNHKWMLPFVWVWRLLKLLNVKRFRRSASEFGAVGRMEDEEKQKMADLLKKLGLKTPDGSAENVDD